MAMTVAIANAVGGTPTWSDVGATTAKYNRIDTLTGVTPIPTPTATGTNFSFIKTFMVNVTAHASLAMSDVKVGKVTTESIGGTKLWHVTSDAEGSYVQATAAPSATGDNNIAAPTMNGATGVAMPLIGSAAVYSAGPFSGSNGRKGNIVEIAVGVDVTNVTAGTAVAIPTARWQWTES